VELKDDKGNIWIEVTKEMQAQAEQNKKDEAALIGPQIPEHILMKLNPAASASTGDLKLDAAYVNC
jgi:hypothetical protein